MVDSDNFLPDFGKHLLARGVRSFHLIGHMTMGVLAESNGGFTISGSCTSGGASYCASFDFDGAVWAGLSERLQQVLYLNTGNMMHNTGTTACVLDPPLPIRVDFEIVPDALTHSVASGEEFAPLVVERVSDVYLAPSHDALERRHGWWSKLSAKILAEANVDMATLQRLASASTSRAGPLSIGEFLKNLAILRLLQPAVTEESFDAFIETASDQSWLRLTSKQQLHRWAREHGANLTPDSNELLRKGYVNLLVWYAATKILAAAAPGEIEADLRSNWGSNTSTDLFVHEGRCCLARLGTQPLIRDALEEVIGQLAMGHEGIRKIVEMRIAKFSREIWDHPELSTIVEPYIRYDLLRQIHVQRPGLVTDEIAARCQANVERLVRWLMLFAGAEAELFGRGLEALRSQ